MSALFRFVQVSQLVRRNKTLSNISDAFLIIGFSYVSRIMPRPEIVIGCDW